MTITWAAILLLLSLTYRGSCDGIEGFLDDDELIQFVAENEASLQVRFQELRVFPALSFGCHGNITGWRIAVRRIFNGGGTPQVIIWRRSESNSNLYDRVAGERLSRNNVTNISMSTNGGAIYEGHPSSPLEFQPGDVLGILFVREPIVNFVPYLRESDTDAPASHFITRSGSPSGDIFRTGLGGTDRLLPLVALDICVSGSNPSEDYPTCGEAPGVTPTPPSPTDTDATTPSPTDTDAATPSPADTDAVTPSPADTDAATPSPADTDAATPSPADTDAATPSPADTDAATPSPADTDAATPSPVDTDATIPPEVDPTDTDVPITVSTTAPQTGPPSGRPPCDLTTSSSVSDPACEEPSGTAPRPSANDDDNGPLSTKELVVAIAVPLVAVVVVLTVALILMLLCFTHHRRMGGQRIAYGGNHPPVALDMKLAIQPSSPSPYEVSKPMSPVYETVRPWNGQLPSQDPPPPYSEDANHQYDTLQEAPKL